MGGRGSAERGTLGLQGGTPLRIWCAWHILGTHDDTKAERPAKSALKLAGFVSVQLSSNAPLMLLIICARNATIDIPCFAILISSPGPDLDSPSHCVVRQIGNRHRPSCARH